MPVAKEAAPSFSNHFGSRPPHFASPFLLCIKHPRQWVFLIHTAESIGMQ